MGQFRVFLSYTAEDLELHAEVAGSIARTCGWLPVDHRYWAPSGRPSVHECEDQIRDCDALLVLLAHRYGWVPKPEDGGDGQKSITWLEVDFARSQGLIVVPMLLKDGAPWPTNLVEGLGNVPVFEHLQKFRSELRRFHSGFFSERPENLDPLVAGALRNAEKALNRQSQRSKHIASASRDNDKVVQSAVAFGVQRQAFSKMLVDCLSIAPGEQLMVVHDESLDPFLPALIDELGHRRIQSTIIQLPKKYQMSLITHTGGDLLQKNILPAGVAAAVREASAILSCLDSDLVTTVVRRAVLILERPGTSRLLHIDRKSVV